MLRIVKKAKPKNYIECTLYGYVYDSRLVDVERCSKEEILIKSRKKFKRRLKG